MRKIKSVFFTFTFTILLLLFTLPTNADSYTWQCGESVKATYNTSTGVLNIYGTGAMYGDWAPLPYAGMKSVMIGQGVTSIGPNTFKDLPFSSVSLPSTLQSIGRYAFSGCDNLTSVTIPDSVTSIGNGAFYYCSSLSTAALGSQITEIPDYLFYYCRSLDSVTIPDGVTRIGNYAFKNSVSSIVIPDSVTTIGDYAFSSLTEVDMGNSVQIIGEGAFFGAGITTIDLPDTLTTIGAKAFYSCDNLTEITIPKQVTSIGSDTFYGCTALQTVNYNAVNCTSTYVFQNCSSVKNINIGDSVQHLPAGAFYGCSAVEKLTIPNSIQSIGRGAIGNCSGLQELTIPFVGRIRGNTGTEDSCLGYIFDYKFTTYISGSTGNCSQGYVNGNNYVTFNLPTSLWKIVITDETVIGYGALSQLHSVTEIVLPDTLRRIEADAFYYSSALSSITLPNNLTYIGEDAFWGCSALSNVVYNARNCSDEASVWPNSSSNVTLTIGANVASLINFANLNTTTVNYNAKNCTSAGRFSEKTEVINIGQGVTTLPEYAFAFLPLVTTITIPDSVTYIDYGAFYNCSGLREFTIPDSVKHVGGIFFGCDNLKTVYIGNGLEEMDHLMFSQGSTLENYVVSTENKHFSSLDGNLYNKEQTHLIHYAPGKTEETFTVPSTVTHIDDYSCRWSSLKTLFLPSSILSIGQSAFYGCTNLTNIYFDGDAPAVGETPFEASKVTLFYIPGMTGWTDSDAYDAAAETWNGYNLAVWEEMVKEEIPYAFTTSMTAALELESEVFLNVAPQLTKDGTALTAAEAQAIEGGVGIMIWDAATAPAEADATIDVCDNIILGSSYNTSTKRFDVKSEGIAAKNLGDNLTIRAFYKDGDQVIYGKYVASYSPKTYCYNQIKKAAATKDVCIALLNYGAAAQVYFGYNTDSLMNTDLTDTQKAWVWDGSLVRDDWSVDSAKEGDLTRNKTIVNSRAGSLELEGAINVVFSGGAKNITVAKAELLLWDETAYNAADVLSEENAAEVVDMTLRDDGKYEYIYKGVAAKEMFKIIYGCQKYTDTNGNVYYGGVMPFCAERYGYMHTEDGSKLGVLAQCMVIYGDAARTYFS